VGPPDFFVLEEAAMKSLVLRLWRDQNAQDLVEYALLTTFIGFAGIAVMDILISAIGNAYGAENQAVYDLGNPPAPYTTGAS
jgi:Flp pilus assembly pilin Flp